MSIVSKDKLHTDSEIVLAIGGIGGSGTRSLANALDSAGVSVCNGLENSSSDTMLYPAIEAILRREWMPLLQNERKVFYEILKFELALRAFSRKSALAIGWKSPGTWFNLPDFKKYFDDSRRVDMGLPEVNFFYIHLVRHPGDMATSKNQNQFNRWKREFGLANTKFDSQSAMTFWARASNRCLDFMARNMPKTSILIRFEDLIRAPADELKRISILTSTDLNIDKGAEQILTPEGLGRYKTEVNISPTHETLRAMERLSYQW